MNRVKTSLDYKRILRLIWLVLTVLVFLGYSLQSVVGSIHYSMVMQAYGTVSSPPIILEEGNCSGASTIYTNKTSAKVNVTAPLFDYIDNNSSNVDSSSGKGTHSNFTAQQYGPDLINDTLREASLSVALIVNNPSSPSSTQDAPFYNHINGRSGWSATYLAASPLPDVSAYDLVVVSYSVGTSPDFSAWTTLEKPILMMDRRHADDIEFTTDEGGYTISQTAINITDNTHYITQPYSLGSLTIASSTYFSHAGSIGGDVDVLAILGTDTTKHMIIEVDNGETLSDGITTAPERRAYWCVAYSGTTINAEGWSLYDRILDWLALNYELDLEVQWTNATYNLPNEELCIFGGTMGSEDIQVDVWNGSTWHNLFTDLSSGWNNVSVSSYLTSSNFTIRFKGGTETGDTTQDGWNIDVTLLHVWTSEGTYDHVLKVVNQVADNWTVNLQVYDNSSIERLSSLNITFHDGTTSNQIAVSGGSIIKSEGEQYNLPGGVNLTIYIGISNLQATATGTSYIYIHLKIQVSNTSTYILYIIILEIT